MGMPPICVRSGESLGPLDGRASQWKWRRPHGGERRAHDSAVLRQAESGPENERQDSDVPGGACLGAPAARVGPSWCSAHQAPCGALPGPLDARRLFASMVSCNSAARPRSGSEPSLQGIAVMGASSLGRPGEGKVKGRHVSGRPAHAWEAWPVRLGEASRGRRPWRQGGGGLDTRHAANATGGSRCRRQGDRSPWGRRARSGTSTHGRGDWADRRDGVDQCHRAPKRDR
jgi:hypothetical protein